MLLIDPKGLGGELRSKTRARTNPPRTPPELLETYAAIEKWAAKDMKWLTENAKMDKPVRGERWVVRGVSFMPATDAKKFFLKRVNGRSVVDRKLLKQFNVTEQQVRNLANMCPSASKGCMAVCLADAGQMVLTASKNAQLRRQLAFTNDRKAYMTVTAVAIAKVVQYAKKKRARTGIRLNVTSDIDWENIPVQVDRWLADYLYKITGWRVRVGRHANLMSVFPRVMFYDYTKVWPRMDRFLRGKFPRNYFLTWSLTEQPTNRRHAVQVLKSKKSSVATAFDITAYRGRGLTVEQKFEKAPLPEALTIGNYTAPVVDADKHDLRFRDPKGSVAGLRFKVPRKKNLKGMSTKEKIEAAGAFVIKTGGSKHPKISIG